MPAATDVKDSKVRDDAGNVIGVRVFARLKSIEDGWHGTHHRRVARIEILGLDSPFDAGASIVVDAEPLKGLEAGQTLELQIRPIAAA